MFRGSKSERMTFGYADDGMCTLDVYGRLVRVFRPRWWQVARMLRWLLSEDGIQTEIAWIVPVQQVGRASLFQSRGRQAVLAYVMRGSERPPRTVPGLELH